MRDETTLALRPDLFGQLAATDPFQGRARRLYERGQVLAVNGNQADVRVGYDARNNPLDLKEVPIVSGYIPRVGDWVAIQYEAGHSGAPWVAGPSMAADESEDTPGIGVFSVSSEEPTDPQKSTVYFHEPASTWRGWNGAAWVDLGGGGGGLHNSLPDLQGGASGEYYHLTAAQWNALTGNLPFGAGGVVYADAAGALKTDAANFLWDAINKRLGIGTDTPVVSLEVRAGTDEHAKVYIDPTDASKGSIIYFRQGGEFGWHLGYAGAEFNFTESGVATRLTLSKTTGQLQASSGAADTPVYSFMAYPTMGFWASASDRVTLEVGGLQVVEGTISTQGGTGYPPAGAGPGAELRYASGRASLLGYDRAGSYYPVELRGSALYFNLSGNDRASLTGGGVWWLYPHSPSLTADGEAAMDSTHETLRWRMGTMQCLGASLVDDARVSDATVHDSGGELTEQAISTRTVQAEFSTSGNTVKVVAKGTARIAPKGSGGGATMHIKFRIEGTDVLDLMFNPAQADYAVWIHYEFSFEATIRASTSWEISNVKAGYATWQQTGDPWPCSFTPTQRWYGRDTPLTVSGDITTQVRCSISNSAPGASYITVAKHQAGLEQT